MRDYFFSFLNKQKTDKIVFSVDDVETGAVKAGAGFWSRGAFDTLAPGISKYFSLFITLQFSFL